MPYIEFVGPPGCGKTTAAVELLRANPELAPGRRTLTMPGAMCHVNRLGLPPGEVGVWLALAVRSPHDLYMAVRFWMDTRSFRLGRMMSMLLFKSRALAASSQRWVVDQGLQQHVLSAFANSRLAVDRALWWKGVCSSGLWAPERIVPISLDHSELLLRVEKSEKHMRQCGAEPPEIYVDKFVHAFKELEKFENCD